MYPNPSSGKFTLKWAIDVDGPYSLIIYDAAGQEVKKVFDRKIKRGIYERGLNFNNAMGVYIAELIDYTYGRVLHVRVLVFGSF